MAGKKGRERRGREGGNDGQKAAPPFPVSSRLRAFAPLRQIFYKPARNLRKSIFGKRRGRWDVLIPHFSHFSLKIAILQFSQAAP